jgi:hypothetical protein
MQQATEMTFKQVGRLNSDAGDRGGRRERQQPIKIDGIWIFVWAIEPKLHQIQTRRKPEPIH